MAAVLYLFAFAQSHETVTGTAFAVAGGAKARNVAHRHQPIDHFVQRAGVADVKLSGIFFFRFRLGIAADAGF